MPLRRRWLSGVDAPEKDAQGQLEQDDGTVLIRTVEAWKQMQLDSRPVVVMFTSQLCGACKRMRIMFPMMRQHLPSDVTLAIVDADSSEKDILRDALGEFAFMPAFQVYRQGQRLAYFAASDEESLRKKVETSTRAAASTSWHRGCFPFLVRK